MNGNYDGEHADFVMTWPAFVPASSNKQPRTFSLEFGRKGIATFTDHDLLQRFAAETPVSDTLVFNDSESLVQWLNEQSGQIISDGPIVDVLIDPNSESASRRFQLRDFLRYLEGRSIFDPA